jgi:hypothetical protein
MDKKKIQRHDVTNEKMQMATSRFPFNYCRPQFPFDRIVLQSRNQMIHQATFLWLVFQLVTRTSHGFVPRAILNKNAVVSLSSSLKNGSLRSSTARYFFDFLKPKEPQQEKEAESEPPEFEDPAEKLFSFFFGAKEEEPMGMKRFGRGMFRPLWNERVREQMAAIVKRMLFPEALSMVVVYALPNPNHVPFDFGCLLCAVPLLSQFSCVT